MFLYLYRNSNNNFTKLSKIFNHLRKLLGFPDNAIKIIKVSVEILHRVYINEKIAFREIQINRFKWMQYNFSYDRKFVFRKRIMFFIFVWLLYYIVWKIAAINYFTQIASRIGGVLKHWNDLVIIIILESVNGINFRIWKHFPCMMDKFFAWKKAIMVKPWTVDASR